MPWLTIFFYILTLAVGFFILTKSSHFVIHAATRLGHQLRISQFLTGFVILGLATSSPEISVGISSAFSGTPQLSLGNLLGANIVLLTVISGLTAILNRGISITQELKTPTRLVQIALVILAPLILLIDSHLSRLDAVFLIVLFTGYIIYLYRLHPKNSPPLETPLLNQHVFHTAFLLVIGFLGLFLSSKAIVLSSVKISSLFSLPPIIIGTLLLSIGTNLPEISVVLAAIKQHHTNLVIGDVLGSACTNTLVIAMVALISPFSINNTPIFQSTAIFLIISLAAFYFTTHSKNRLSLSEGLFLFTIYIAFLVSQILSLYLET